MHETALLLHSYNRWLALTGALLVLGASAWASARRRPWSRAHRRLWVAWVAAFDTQVLLGLLLYLWLSPTAAAARHAGLAASGQSIFRFWLMEHPLTMLVAAAVLHVGGVSLRRTDSDARRHRRAALTTAATLALVVAAVPWPGRGVGRPLARGTAIGNDMTACAEPSPEIQSALPARLSETGLYVDIAAKRVAADVEYYRPRFELWSDGAAKARWIRLPAGSAIDTSDADAWRFPVGTSVWKEFSLYGKRLETRLFRKVGPGERDWAQMAYLWDDDESDAEAVPAGRVDVRGTDHDVPSAAQCAACHGQGANAILGFSAVQLSHDGDGVTLAVLRDSGRLTRSVRDVIIPGSPAAVSALGALYANCAHCHDSTQGATGRPRCYDPNGVFDFSLSAEGAEPAVVRTGMRTLIIPGDPDASPLLRRMSSRSGWVPGMPPLATEHVDPTTVTAVRRWIEELRER